MNRAIPLVRRAAVACALAAVIVIVLWQPLLALRTLPVHDFLIHLRWADQFYTAMQEGHFLPRWNAASFSGLGDPTFFYYQPLFYYVSSVFLQFGASANRALVLAAALPYILLAAIAYHTILKRHPDKWGLAAASLVVTSPAFLFISTHMGLLPWTLGIPLSVLFIMESIRQRPRVAMLAILLCLTCLSHLLSALMALCCAGLTRLLLTGNLHRSLGTHIRWGAGLAIGLSLAAFFVYPAVTQLNLINPDGWTSDPAFDWHASLMFPTFTYVMFGAHWMACQWLFPVLVLALALFVVLARNDRVAGGGDMAFRYAVASLVALGLGSELAYPLYTYLSPMQKLQFPYRFLPIAAIFAAIAFGLHLKEGGWQRASRLKRAIAVLCILGHFVQALFVQWSLFQHGKPLPDRATFMKGNFGQVEYLLNARGPHWKQFIDDGKLTGECTRLNIACKESPKLTHAYGVTVEATHPVTMRLPVFAFPAWELRIDGQPQPLVADPKTGLVLVNLPAGRHIASLSWTSLPADRTGRIITLAGLGLFVLFCAVPWIFARRSKRSMSTSTGIPA